MSCMKEAVYDLSMQCLQILKRNIVQVFKEMEEGKYKKLDYIEVNKKTIINVSNYYQIKSFESQTPEI